MAASARPSRFWATLSYLGRTSFAVQLVYLPIDIIYFRASHSLFGTLHGLQVWALLIGVFPAILLAAAAAHHVIQLPAAGWLIRRDPFKNKGGA
jgi:peptidoglycan/LPS O-acetylase OafA/YrhL